MRDAPRRWREWQGDGMEGGATGRSVRMGAGTGWIHEYAENAHTQGRREGGGPTAMRPREGPRGGGEPGGGGTEREVLSLGRDAGARQRPGPRVPSQRFTYGARRAGIPERLLGGGVTSLGTGWTEEGRAEGGAWGRVPCA
jgi:hypothetical protein